jgi:hypothetical protein
MDFMFVHWSADDNAECYKDIYEVSVAVETCPCCAHCWRTYGYWCTLHSSFRCAQSYYEVRDSPYRQRPVKVKGFDFVTYVNTPHGYPVAPVEPTNTPHGSSVAPVEPTVEHMPRRSKRIRKTLTF